MTITILAPDGVQITAKQWRQARAAEHGGGAGRRLGGRSGFRVDTPADVLTVTSTTWTLGPCAAMIDPMRVTNQGMYGWASDANITGSIEPAHDTYARIDRLFVDLLDDTAGDGSGEIDGSVTYQAGQPSANPQAPNYAGLLVGTITVPPLGGGSPTVQLNPARYASAGAPLPVYGQPERDDLDLFDGLIVQRRDVAGSPTETRHGSSWYRQPVSVEHALAVSDGNFTISGGLIKTVTAGLTQVTASLELVRSNAVGITLPPAGNSIIVGAIPAGFRPPGNFSLVGSVLTNDDARYAEPELIVNNGGSIVGRSTSGGDITIAQGYKLYVTGTWFV